MGIDEEMVQAYVAFDTSDRIPEHEKAILRLAVKSTTDPQGITDADVDAVKALGYSDAEIVEILLVANFHSVIARMNESLGVVGGAWTARV
jgi:alkylhydroperoxidase family enzyme